MKKICGLLFVGSIWSLQAGTIVALLKGVENNHRLHMVHKKDAFVCTPYGIETVSELVLRTDVNSSCMGYLKDFRLSNPKENFFAVSNLHVQQQYSVEGIEDRCLLHLSSGHTYSEALLEKGYARIPLKLNHDDFLLKRRFKRAMQRAKNKKAGIWSDINVRNCFLLAKEEK